MTKTSQMVTFLIFLLFIGFFSRNSLFIFGLIIIFGIFLVMWLWNRFCFSKLTIKRSFSRDRIFYGEDSQYIVEIENRKLMPMLWLQVNDIVTKGVNFANTVQVSSKVGTPYNVFTDVFNLKWYERVIRKYPVKPTGRGYYLFGKGELMAADLFGFQTQTLHGKDRIYLLVYPRVVPIERFGLPRINPFGRQQKNHWIYEDPTNRVGVRPYQQGDRFNQINWKSTAQFQSLQSNVIKPTMDNKLLIILNTKLMNAYWEGFVGEDFEVAVMCAASVADYALKEQYQVGLLTNGIIYEQTSIVKIFPGKSSRQREKILEALAMVEPYHQKDIDTMIYNEIPKMEVGTTIVFITVILNQRLIDCLRVLKKKGYNPTVIKIGQSERELINQLPGIQVYLVDEEGLRSEIKNIQFV